VCFIHRHRRYWTSRFCSSTREFRQTVYVYRFNFALVIEFEIGESFTLHLVSPLDSECVVVPMLQITRKVWTKTKDQFLILQRNLQLAVHLALKTSCILLERQRW